MAIQKDVDATLENREKVYGSFKDYSKIARELKYIVNAADQRIILLSNDKREALDMIMSKVARILNGDPDYIDSWHDIAGYATLIVNNLEDEEGIE
jgi:hypothetical protein